MNLFTKISQNENYCQFCTDDWNLQSLTDVHKTIVSVSNGRLHCFFQNVAFDVKYAITNILTGNGSYMIYWRFSIMTRILQAFIALVVMW